MRKTGTQRNNEITSFLGRYATFRIRGHVAPSSDFGVAREDGRKRGCDHTLPVPESLFLDHWEAQAMGMVPKGLPPGVSCWACLVWHTFVTEKESEAGDSRDRKGREGG